MSRTDDGKRLARGKEIINVGIVIGDDVDVDPLLIPADDAGNPWILRQLHFHALVALHALTPFSSLFAIMRSMGSFFRRTVCTPSAPKSASRLT